VREVQRKFGVEGLAKPRMAVTGGRVRVRRYYSNRAEIRKTKISQSIKRGLPETLRQKRKLRAKKKIKKKK